MTTYHPSALAALIEGRAKLPVRFNCKCNSRMAAAALSSQLVRLDYSCTVNDKHVLIARGPQPSAVPELQDWTVPNGQAET